MAHSKARRESSFLQAEDFLLPVYDVLTESLCEEVFEATRDGERRRKWTLHAMAWFWIGLLRSKFSSQTRGVLEAGEGHELFPKVDATPESFFQRARRLRPEFFRNLFKAVAAALAKSTPEVYLPEVGVLPFERIVAVDGSRLPKVGRLLKGARKTAAAILPGSLSALYDLKQGLLVDLAFDPDGHASELGMLDGLLASLKPGWLLLADRLYAKPVVWRKVAATGARMISRFNRSVKVRNLEELSRLRGAINYDDWIVEMGGSRGTEPVRLRMIRAWGNASGQRFDVRLLTDELDPEKLPPLEAASLYRKRWTVERMYLALKDLLELNHLFNASPAAAAQQAYATAILYNSLRSAQARLAEKAGVPASELSEQKLFPALVDRLLYSTLMDAGAERQWRQLSESAREGLAPPDPKPGTSYLGLRIGYYLVERRSEKRKERRFCEGRKKSTSYGKIPGCSKYLLN